MTAQPRPYSAWAANAEGFLVAVRRRLVPLLLALSVLVGAVVCIRPLFGRFIPAYAASEFTAHIGLVAAAVDTLRRTRALPISTTAIHPGIEYPYFIFGNQAFYWVAAPISLFLRVPPYIGAGITLVASFALGTVGMFLLARRAGLNAYLAVGLGFLYAAGPYLSVNLYVRNAFPEYMTWQALPILLVALNQAMRPRAGPWSALAGALALAAPFYLHKLVAPHIALTLGALAFSGSAVPFRVGTLARLALIGVLGILFSAPSWSPAARGLDATTVGILGGASLPAVFHPSLVNLFWPWAQSSLPEGPSFDFYEKRFALQAGFIPLVGLLAALWTLFTQPRLFWAQRLALPLTLLAFNAVLILGAFGAWNLTPSPLRYLQFSYRLVGLAHLLGFVLFIQTISSPRQRLLRRATPRLRRAAALVCLGLATLSTMTYWHRPPVTAVPSAGIQARELAELDLSAFWPKTIRSSFVTTGAIDFDGRLVVPPRPIRVAPGAPSIRFAGTPVPELFEQSSDPLVVRIYGVTRQQPDASLDRLLFFLADVSYLEQTVAPISTLWDKQPADEVPSTGGVGDSGDLALADLPWTARRLAETAVAGPEAVRLSASLANPIDALVVECSRSSGDGSGRPVGSGDGGRCLSVDFLAVPNDGEQFILPREIPESRRSHQAFGTVRIDGRDLPRGQYFLPTFDYNFVRATASDGSAVPTYQFDRRPVFRHAGDDSYTVAYDLRPELLALGGAMALFAAYATMATALRRSPTGARLAARSEALLATRLDAPVLAWLGRLPLPRPRPPTRATTVRLAGLALAALGLHIRAQLPLLLLVASIAVGVIVCVVPVFGAFVPAVAAYEFISHVALVAAAQDTMRETHALAISSDAIHPGIEYPYFLFGSPLFYQLAALVSLALSVPPYLGTGLMVGLAFAIGVGGVFLLARRANLNPYVSVALGFLYASGPYLSLNLLIRNAFPEYLTWQAFPSFLLLVRGAAGPNAGPWLVLGGTLALALPSYLHKLVAPHVTIALLILALGTARTPRALLRLALTGALAALLIVPAWYPAVRGLDAFAIGLLSGAAPPNTLDQSLLNLLWPWARNSLPDVPAFAFYEGRFALQVGLVPLAGFVAALWVLVRRPRLALAHRLWVPLVLFAAYVLLIVDAFGVWALLPSPIRYVEFTYRLIGLAHALGFVLLVQAAAIPSESLWPRLPPPLRPLVAVACIGVALLASATYWYRPTASNVVSATLDPTHLGDRCLFCRPTIRGNLTTQQAIAHDGWLVVPPWPVVIQGQPPSVAFLGRVPAAILDQAAEPLIVGLYGFSRLDPEAELDHLPGAIGALVGPGGTGGLGTLFDPRRPGPSPSAAGGVESTSTQVPNIPWTVTRLVETSVASVEPLLLEAPLSDAIVAVAVECSRSVPEGVARAPSAGSRALCVDVDFFATANDGARFMPPQEIDHSRVTRSAFGRLLIDAQDLPAGHYILPTFNYAFVRTTAAGGARVPTYDFDRRPAFRHDGSTASYTVGYAFEPELLALGAALVLFAPCTVAAAVRASRTP